MVLKMMILALFVGSACAAVWIGKLPAKPKEFAAKEGCYIEEINDVIPFGKSVSPLGYCYRITCGKETIDYASCIHVSTEDPKCNIIEEDTSKLYPACCQDIKCDLENNII